ERRDVARETLPGRCVGRGRLAEGEAGELEKNVLRRDVAFAGLVEQGRVCAGARRCGEVGRVDGVAALGRELDIGLHEGADPALFAGGEGIARQGQTGPRSIVVVEAVLLAEIAVPGRLAVRAAVEGDVGAEIAAELDAGIGTRDE